MKREDIKVCVMRVGGTNCDREVKRVFDHLGADAEVVHGGRFIDKRRSLEEFDVLVFPGGFSYGDHIRAGAIWASDLKAHIGKDLKDS